MIDFELMNHQKDILTRASYQPNLYMAWDPGLGKTCATIQILRQKYMLENRLLSTLVLGPVIVQENWKREFEKFSRVEPRDVVVLKGPVKKRIQMIESREKRATIFILNYDVMNNKDIVQALLKHGIDILVADEVHYVKSPTSKRAKGVLKIAENTRCKHRLLLSGTPILNSPMDLFMQYRILDQGATLGNNFIVYRNTYFQDMNASWAGSPNYYPDWQPREVMYSELSKRLENKMMVVKKEDVLKDLPDLTVENVYPELSAEQRRHYKEMKNQFVTYLEELDKSGEPKAVVAQLAITRALRLQQIVSGFLKTDDEEEIVIKNNPRLDYLKELLENIAPSNKVIVWACFKNNYTQIAKVCKDLGLGYVELHGGTKSKERQKNVDAFNDDPGIRVLIGNAASAGIGINLISASYAIYYSRGFKLGDDIQSEARNYRKGSEIHEKITRINMVCPGSIDELIAEALDRKQKISDQILGWKDKL